MWLVRYKLFCFSVACFWLTMRAPSKEKRRAERAWWARFVASPMSSVLQEVFRSRLGGGMGVELPTLTSTHCEPGDIAMVGGAPPAPRHRGAVVRCCADGVRLVDRALHSRNPARTLGGRRLSNAIRASRRLGAASDLQARRDRATAGDGAAPQHVPHRLGPTSPFTQRVEWGGCVGGGRGNI